MKKFLLNKRRLILWVPLVLLLLVVWLLQRSPFMAEWYARTIYPTLSNILSSISSLVSFSLGDFFITFSVLGLLIYPFYARYKQEKYKSILSYVLVYLGYVYVWFYLAWGLNYFRLDYYERTDLKPIVYDSLYFQTFLSDFTSGINDSYQDSIITIDTALVMHTGKVGYQHLAPYFHMMRPEKTLSSKPMISSDAMSKVGVLGYMAPFFSEFCVNKELLPIQYPFTYIHEMSHRLGIASEAEANLYAYLICSTSKDSNIRLSGYMSLFPYVLSNAYGLLSKEDYQVLLSSFRPEILTLYKNNRTYWDAKYSPLIGKVQHEIYNLFLKSNNIKQGTANYSQVIGLLLSLKQTEKYELSNFL